MSGSIKLVVVGDGAVGKTCLLIVYTKGEFPKEYVPTVFDNYSAKVKIEQTVYNVQLWDTAGQEELENIRTLSYANTNVFLLCFSVVSPSTFENVTGTWLPELKRFNTNPTIMLVGTKTDLRKDDSTLRALSAENQVPISREKGEAKAKEIGAIGYVECSAFLNENVKNVFDQAITHVVFKPETGCCRLG